MVELDEGNCVKTRGMLPHGQSSPHCVSEGLFSEELLRGRGGGELPNLTTSRSYSSNPGTP